MVLIHFQIPEQFVSFTPASFLCKFQRITYIKVGNPTILQLQRILTQYGWPFLTFLPHLLHAGGTFGLSSIIFPLFVSCPILCCHWSALGLHDELSSLPNPLKPFKKRTFKPIKNRKIYIFLMKNDTIDPHHLSPGLEPAPCKHSKFFCL